MANITPIDPTKSVSLAPAIINQNFTNVNAELGQLSQKLKYNTSSLELNGAVTAPNNGAEAAVFVATGTTGYLFDGFVDGNNRVFSVNVAGLLTAIKIELDPNQLSKIGQLEANGVITAKENIVVEKDIQLLGVVKKQQHVLEVIPTNVGDAAANPVNLSDKEEVMIDFSNGGAQFVAGGSDALLKIDRSTLKVGQKLFLRLFKRNSVNELKLWNGDASQNLFASIDYTSGYSDIVYTTYPEFDHTASGNAWLLCQYTEVASGVFRLVILDSKNIINV
jgi:hypothetical protein